MSNQKKRTWIVLLAAALLFGTVPGAAAGPSETVEQIDEEAAGLIQEIDVLLGNPETAVRELPADPRQALEDVTNVLMADLGVSPNPTVSVQVALLPEDVAGHLALLLADARECYLISAAHWAAMPHDEDSLRDIMTTGGGLDPAQFTDIRTCAEDLWVSTTSTETAFASMLSPPRDCDLRAPISLDIWPVIRFEGACRNTEYLNDYLVIVDAGGHDTYINNVGSNMVDLNFAPATSPVPGARGFGPSQGCDLAVAGLAAGDCIPAVAVLLDLDGEDTFGVKQSPVIDAECTDDPVVRRLLTVGVGFLGVGVLLDAADQNDAYTGKTGSAGAGHIFGVGLLVDRGGNEHYHNVRNSQGFALVGGVGILRDERGNDVYDFYLPAPLDPQAPNQSPGAGGVIDDEGVCDNRLRFLQGGGNVAGPTIGILIDDAGNDRYVGGFSDDFLAPAGEGRGGSQGFGNNGGFGILVDAAGLDSYAIVDQVGEQGAPTRGDRVIIPPAQESTGPGGIFADLA